MTQSLWKKLTVWTDNQNDDKVKINVAKKKQEIWANAHETHENL